MGDSTKSFNTSLSKDCVTGTVALLKKVLHKINMVYKPEKYHKLIEQSRRKWKFSVTMCNDNFSTEYKWWWPKLYKKHTMSVQSYGEAVPRASSVK
jgi:hypothetical protein